MIMRPDLSALLLGSSLAGLMTLTAAAFGFIIVRRWDLGSGSDGQLALERRTYLVSTLVAWALVLDVASLFFFIRTADSIAPLFAGAMCAAGTLAANSYGYPAVILKITTSLLASLWLIVNRADNAGCDYPLIRHKYVLLLAAAPLVLAETVMQLRFFSALKPDIITSCCGSLFSNGAGGVGATLAALPALPVAIAFFICTSLSVCAGLFFVSRGHGAYFVGILGTVLLPLAIAAVVSFISLYIYEMPSHHCPFCLLQKEYGYVGYPLYGFLFLATASAWGVAVLQAFPKKESIASTVPMLQRKLGILFVTSTLSYTLLVLINILASDLKLVCFP